MRRNERIMIKCPKRITSDSHMAHNFSDRDLNLNNDQHKKMKKMH